MRRTAVLAATGWLAAVVAATLTGLAAVTLIGRGLVGGDPARPLSEDQIVATLAAATPTPSAPASPTGAAATTTAAPSASGSATRSPSRSPTRSAPAVRLDTPGGFVLARCARGLATIESVSPAQGYAVDDLRAGPAREARVKFEREEDGEIQARVTCGSDGTPQISWARD